MRDAARSARTHFFAAAARVRAALAGAARLAFAVDLCSTRERIGSFLSDE